MRRNPHATAQSEIAQERFYSPTVMCKSRKSQVRFPAVAKRTSTTIWRW